MPWYGLAQIPAYELRVPIDPVQGARHAVTMHVFVRGHCTKALAELGLIDEYEFGRYQEALGCPKPRA